MARFTKEQLQDLEDALRALSEELGGRYRVNGHGGHYIEISDDLRFIVSLTLNSRASMCVSMVGNDFVHGHSGMRHSWREIEAWIHKNFNWYQKKVDG